MAIKVCRAGASGWAGSELARSIPKTADLSIVAAVARRSAGKKLGEVAGEPSLSAMLAIRKVNTLLGGHRGLDRVLEL